MIVNPETVLLAQSGDESAIEELVAASKKVVYSIIVKRVRNVDDADDVTQDVFLRMVRKLYQLEDPAKFSGWICQMADRLAINKALRRPKEKVAEFTIIDVARNNDPSCGITKKEAANLLHKAMRKLGKIDKDVLHIYYFGGTPVKEIAEMLNVPIGTVKRRMCIARERLRNEIAKITKTELHPAN